ncbi:hypothetical protein CDD83_7392 [Cordyceps sp. RAO-2017]|nr:hypothetical protein CDD83_7392 [Cordyceps sp. RAO-2017]
MKSSARYNISFSILALSASYVLAAGEEPTLNLDDPRWNDWKPAGDGDVRSACPGLNSLANHGFLPRNGQNVTGEAIVRACFEGFGMSPEIPAIIVLKGLTDAKLPLDDVFDLHAADRRSWAIEHSRSLSRDDLSPETPDLPPVETSRFQERPWTIALDAMEKCGGGKVDAACFGKARAAMVRDGNARNPDVKYDKAAAGHGSVEAARIMIALGSRNGADLKFIKSVFEQERLPRNLGWTPRAFSGDIDEMLDAAVDTQKVDKILRCTSNGRVATRSDVIETFNSDSTGFVDEVKALIKKAGFNKQSILDALDRVDKERTSGQQQPQSDEA